MPYLYPSTSAFIRQLVLLTTANDKLTFYNISYQAENLVFGIHAGFGLWFFRGYQRTTIAQ